MIRDLRPEELLGQPLTPFETVNKPWILYIS